MNINEPAICTWNTDECSPHQEPVCSLGVEVSGSLVLTLGERASYVDVPYLLHCEGTVFLLGGFAHFTREITLNWGLSFREAACCVDLIMVL